MISWRNMKSESAWSARKIMATVFWGEKDVIPVNFLPRRKTVNSDSCTETLRSLHPHCHLLSLSHKRNVWRVSPPWQCQAIHRRVHRWGRKKNWMDSVATLTLQSWPHTIKFSPVSYFETEPAMTPLHRRQGTAEHWVAVAAEGREQHLLHCNACYWSKMEEGCWQWCRLYWETGML
jgi:hypothetical protein